MHVESNKACRSKYIILGHLSRLYCYWLLRYGELTAWYITSRRMPIRNDRHLYHIHCENEAIRGLFHDQFTSYVWSVLHA